MRLAYFVPDTGDPAVRRRVRMLHAGGAEVTVIGFRRESTSYGSIEGAAVIDLGRTHDGRLGHRARAVLARVTDHRRWAEEIATADVLLARNLEMLTLAAVARRAKAPRAGLVYECLDIHRALLAANPASAALRGVERRLLGLTQLLVVSSPAFLSQYFEPIQRIRTPALLVENKVLELDSRASPPPRRPAGPPWRLGWFGKIRCERSLRILCGLAQRRPDLVRVAIRGTIARDEIPDFEKRVDGVEAIEFGASYTASDLPRLYGDVHFTWAIDYFEAGGNSKWLLPNRIYEGPRFGAVPLALRSVEVGRWLAERKIGLLMSDPEQDLETLLERMTPRRYGALRLAIERQPQETFVAGLADCTRLTEALARTSGRSVVSRRSPTRAGATAAPRAAKSSAVLK